MKHQTAFNAIPQIDKCTENGYPLEEMKMVHETRKIMGDESIEVTAICVRIPVVRGILNPCMWEFKNDDDLEDVQRLLSNAPGVTLVEDPSFQSDPLDTDVQGKPDVFVGRLRRGLAHKRRLNMWIVSDNLLKGAAWNAVENAELIVNKRNGQA